MPPSNLKARTALAAEIAGVDRMRFNEAVAAGFYTCAPNTIRGSTRVFDVNDIVALRVYGWLLDEGVIPRSAGRMACGLRDLLKEHPNAKRVLHIMTSFGVRNAVWLRSEDFNRSHKSMGGGDIVSIREWDLTLTRARVVHRLQEEASILGAAEDGDD